MVGLAGSRSCLGAIALGVAACGCGAAANAGGQQASPSLEAAAPVTASAGDWTVEARPVSIEAGPNGLQVTVTARGPLVVRQNTCNENTVLAWLVDSAGRTVRSSNSVSSPTCVTSWRSVPADGQASWSTVIPWQGLSQGTYTLHGLVATTGQVSGEDLPELQVAVPWT